MYKCFKWIMDRVLAFVGIVAMFPIFILTCIIIAIDSNGPVLIVQVRDGQYKKPIRVYKFRTMYSANVEFDMEHAVIDGGNSNVTRVGRLLRKFKVDELPQLFNILKGDMSFIGPRPLLPVYSPKYERWEFQKFLCKPGLSGLSQVNGNGYLRVKTRSYYDVLYSEKVSLWLDIKILFKTIAVILLGEKSQMKEVTDEEIEEMRVKYSYDK